MKPVLSTEEVVRLEDIIEREGTSKDELMELAGEFAAHEVLKLTPDRVLFHSPPGVLFTFPHGTGSLSVPLSYLALSLIHIFLFYRQHHDHGKF